ncbi:MAG: NlpC/P60 family protein [Clostridia bacterium]|nr:NlpC/P60 family protein [Clostridia bacterium]
MSKHKKFFMLLLSLLLLFTALPTFAEGEDAEATSAPQKPALVLAASYTMKAEDKAKLEVEISPETANMPLTLVWASSDEAILSVDQYTGEITALKEGKAKVTVSAADGSCESAACKITVKKSSRVPIDAPIEGNVFNSNYGQMDEATVKAVRDYCEKLGNSKGEKIVRTALGYLGVPYDKVDCSKLAQLAYKANGVKIARVSDEQAKDLAKYIRADGIPKAGDLFFMKFPSWRTTCSCGTSCRRYMNIHHSAMYLGNINGRTYVVDSSSYIGRVIIREYYGNMIAGMPVVFVAGRG